MTNLSRPITFSSAAQAATKSSYNLGSSDSSPISGSIKGAEDMLGAARSSSHLGLEMSYSSGMKRIADAGFIAPTIGRIAGGAPALISGDIAPYPNPVGLDQYLANAASKPSLSFEDQAKNLIRPQGLPPAFVVGSGLRHAPGETVVIKLDASKNRLILA
jgi:hypothetical protein